MDARLAAGLDLDAAGLRRLAGLLTDGVVAVDRELVVLFANPPAERLLGLAEGATLAEPALRRLALEAVDGRAGGTARAGTFEAHALPTGRGGAALLVLVDPAARSARERAEREFLTNAAHELRTPLTAITSAIEVLQAGAKHDERARELFLGHIERECARLRRVTRALLTLARAQTLQEEPRLELVQVCEVLSSVRESINPGPGVEVEVDCPADLAALADRELLEQAVGALAQNALDYAAAGPIELAARTTPDGAVSVEVADRGPGIPPAVLERVGERFLTGAAGSGLGLAIVAQVARTLRGTLEFDPRPGGGTVARLKLRAARLTRT